MKLEIELSDEEAAEVRGWDEWSAPRRTMPWQELGNRMTQRIADALAVNSETEEPRAAALSEEPPQ